MVTLLLQYKENPINLAVLLTQLQPQLHETDDIYIIDDSKSQNGLKIAVAYGTTRCYILVEVSPKIDRLKAGIQSMVENKQKALIYLSEDAFISSTLISNMKKVIDSEYEIVSPIVNRNPYHKMDANFKFFNSPTIDLEPSEDFDPDCFMLTLQSDKSYARLKNEKVTLLKRPDFLTSTTRP